MSTAAQRLAQRRAAALSRKPVDLSDLFGQPLDQGPRPTCVAVALADAHGRLAEPQYDAAIETLWWDLDQRSLTGPDGILVAHAADALQRTGHCHDFAWPYDTGLGYRSEPPPAAAGTPPWDCATLENFALAQDGVEDQVEAFLAASRPVMLVIEVTDEFFAADRTSGHIQVPDIRAPSGGFHAVLAVGTWTEPDLGRALLIRNSWGDGWGALGYGLMPLEYLVAHAAPEGWYIP